MQAYQGPDARLRRSAGINMPKPPHESGPAVGFGHGRAIERFSAGDGQVRDPQIAIEFVGRLEIKWAARKEAILIRNYYKR